MVRRTYQGGLRILAMVALGAVLLAIGTGSSSARPRLLGVTLPGVVERIAADGNRVAAVVRQRAVGDLGPSTCSAIDVWDAARGSLQRAGKCTDPDSYEWISQVAVAGDRVAWLDVMVTSAVYRNVFSWSPTRGATALAFEGAVTPAGGGGEPGGDHWGYLRGDESLIVFNSWIECYQVALDVGVPPASERCVKGRPRVTNVKLLRLTRDGHRALVIRRGSDAMAAMWVDSGRIVVRDPSGDMAVIRSNGSVARRFSFAAGEVRGLALDGSDLVVLTPTRLNVYGAMTGELRHSHALAASAASRRRLEDVDGGFAVLVERTSIRIVRLRDGKATVIVFAHELGPVDAQLEPAGLYYSYNDRNTAQPGRLALLPRLNLLGRF